MKTEGLKFFTDTQLTSVGLIIFFTLFISMLIWVFRVTGKQTYQYVEQLPLKQDGE